MMLSLFDLMRQQAGRFLPDAALPPWPEWVEEGPDLVLRVQLPSIDPRSVQVQVTETSIGLAGYRTREERTEAQGLYQVSASYGGFARTLPLPSRVIPRESRAAWRENGLLEIRLRKA